MFAVRHPQKREFVTSSTTGRSARSRTERHTQGAGKASPSSHSQRQKRACPRSPAMARRGSGPEGQTGIVPTHYRAPRCLTRNVFNRAVAFLTRHGVSILGSRVLAVKGQTSGAWRTTPVNLLDHDGHRSLAQAGKGRWIPEPPGRRDR